MTCDCPSYRTGSLCNEGNNGSIENKIFYYMYFFYKWFETVWHHIYMWCVCFCVNAVSDIILLIVCTDIDECATSPCQNGAMCNNLETGFVCDCADGYEGDRCETGKI